jgi:5-methylcytosine-specific restriction endonuclease McrA
MDFNNEKDFKLSFEYKVYMKSEPWKVMRKMCLIRAGYMCEKCGAVAKNMGGKHQLHVHHKTYINFGAEDMDDLMVLCSNCHSNEHRKIKW